MWVYQEAQLTPAEFEEYIKVVTAQNAVNGVDISDNQLITMDAIADLYAEQMKSDNNQLIIMEAIADLYGVIESMQQGGVK